MTSPNLAILRFSDTTPEARPLLSISVAKHLEAVEKFIGDRPTISDCTVSCRMHPQSAMIDPNPTARLDANRSIVGDIIAQFFSNGVENADYILTYLVTFSDGSKEAFDAMISIRKFIGL